MKAGLKLDPTNYITKLTKRRIWQMHQFGIKYDLDSLSIGYYIDLHLPILINNTCKTVYDVYSKNLQPESQYDFPLLWEDMIEYEECITAIWFCNEIYFEDLRNVKKLLDRGFFTMNYIKEANQTLKSAMDADKNSLEYKIARHIVGLYYLEGYNTSCGMPSPTMRQHFYTNSLDNIETALCDKKTREIVCKFIVEATHACSGLFAVIRKIPEMYTLLTFSPLHTTPATQLKNYYMNRTLPGKRVNKTLELCCKYYDAYITLMRNRIRDNEWRRNIFIGKKTQTQVKIMVPAIVHNATLDPTRFECNCGCRKDFYIGNLYKIASQYSIQYGMNRIMLEKMGLSNMVIELIANMESPSGTLFCSWVNAIIFIIMDVKQNHQPAFTLPTCDIITETHNVVAKKRHCEVCTTCHIWQCIVLDPMLYFSASKTDGVIVNFLPCVSAYPTAREMKRRKPNNNRVPTINCGSCSSSTQKVDIVGKVLYAKSKTTQSIEPAMLCCGCGVTRKYDELKCRGQLFYCVECTRTQKRRCYCGGIPASSPHKCVIATTRKTGQIVKVYYLCDIHKRGHSHLSIIPYSSKFR